MVGIAKANKQQYGKNLWGIGAILSGAYLLLLNHPSFLIVLGTFLLVEHIWNWGNFTLYDFVGHEYLGTLLIGLGTIKGSYTGASFFGIGLILLGIILNLNKEKKYFSQELKRWFK